MKLSKKAVTEITTNNTLQLKLALALGCYQWTVKRLANNNKEDSKLTSATALAVISKETGLTQTQILTK